MTQPVMMENEGHPLGIHRSLEPVGVLPDSAWRVDNRVDRIWPGEAFLDLGWIQLDAATCRHLVERSAEDPKSFARQTQRTIESRGKFQHPVTGAGGMFGGSLLGAFGQLSPKTTVMSFVPLTATPLFIEKIKDLRFDESQVRAKGTAIVCAGAELEVLPSDLSLPLGLAMADASAVVSAVDKVSSEEERVLIAGAGGKCGVVAAALLRHKLGAKAAIVGVEQDPDRARAAEGLGCFDQVVCADICDAGAARQSLGELEFGSVLNCSDARETESFCALVVHKEGNIFAPYTTSSFARMLQGAQSLGKRPACFVWGSSSRESWKSVWEVVRSSAPVSAWFHKRYG